MTLNVSGFSETKHYAHADSAEIPDSEFTDLWNEGKSLIRRIQIYTTANGCTTDYGLKLTNISGRMIKYEEYTSYVDLFRGNYNPIQSEFKSLSRMN